jgi:ADP-ribose pyrophosphatase YjhB (NUDIX family)
MARPDNVGVGVCIALVNSDGKLLLMRRQGSHAAGTWSIPGGWIDRMDTTLLDVVKREAMEELGVTVLDAEQVGVTTEDHPERGFRTVTVYFLAGRWTGPVSIKEPSKCSEILWHPLHLELPTPQFPGLAEGIAFVKSRFALGSSNDDRLLREALAYEVGRANGLDRELRDLRSIVQAFCETVSIAEAHWERNPGGMAVPFHGDFANANPSARDRLIWWARRFRE